MKFLSKMFGKSSPAPETSSKDEALLIVPMPALVAVLLAAENQKGAPLIKAEVLEIRDGAVCMAMPVHAAERMAEARGYADINPERVWEEWQAFRQSNEQSSD
ncbi:hypothetical protein [Brevundimonas sp.]|uniref:hypothetical protein n=1 Tax=Brevundimonas sp. TaxID=1871086 RepID=UPI002ED7B2A5